MIAKNFKRYPEAMAAQAVFEFMEEFALLLVEAPRAVWQAIQIARMREQQAKKKPEQSPAPALSIWQRAYTKTQTLVLRALTYLRNLMT
ncbi:MAG: hypothetical protein QM803_18910 [Rhodocyclaceae bacterium]